MDQGGNFSFFFRTNGCIKAVILTVICGLPIVGTSLFGRIDIRVFAC